MACVAFPPTLPKPIKFYSASQIAHMIGVSATLWKVAVSGYGNPLTLLIFPLGADVAILFTAITGALVGVRSLIKNLMDILT